MPSLENWVVLAHHHACGVAQTTYLSDSGDMCTLPSEFVLAFHEGDILDVRFAPHPGDPLRVNVIRGGKVDFVVPHTLLRILMAARDETTVGVEASS